MASALAAAPGNIWALGELGRIRATGDAIKTAPP